MGAAIYLNVLHAKVVKLKYVALDIVLFLELVTGPKLQVLCETFINEPAWECNDSLNIFFDRKHPMGGAFCPP